MNTTPITTAVPQDYREAVRSGLAFHRIAASNLSADRMNYAPMMSAGQYGSIVAALGRAAGMGDLYASAVADALRSVSPYLNGWQAAAGIATAFAEFQRKGWYDAATATGPDAGRPSSHQHALTDAQVVVLHLVHSEAIRGLHLGTAHGIGWALRALVAEVNLGSLHVYLPRVAEDLNR